MSKVERGLCFFQRFLLYVKVSKHLWASCRKVKASQWTISSSVLSVILCDYINLTQRSQQNSELGLLVNRKPNNLFVSHSARPWYYFRKERAEPNLKGGAQDGHVGHRGIWFQVWVQETSSGWAQVLGTCGKDRVRKEVGTSNKRWGQQEEGKIKLFLQFLSSSHNRYTHLCLGFQSHDNRSQNSDFITSTLYFTVHKRLSLTLSYLILTTTRVGRYCY